MKKELVIDLKADGTAQAMHMDSFDLGFLGDKQVNRASDILWDEEAQGWGIVVAGNHLPVSEAVCGFTGYEEAREFEVLWFQACRKAQVDPHSGEGASIADSLRNA